MGAQESTLAGSGGNEEGVVGPNLFSTFSPFGIGGPDRFGFQILRVDPNSPSSNCGLEPFFDYIVAVNGLIIQSEQPNIVAEGAKAHIDKEMKLTIYNSREDTIRESIIVPSRSWEGNTLLGAGIRYSKASGITDRNWHILSCSPNSPADKAGFISEKDWIIGCVEISLNSSEDFYHLMTQNLKRDIPLYVYNIDDDSIRIINVCPDFQWGGDGCLGADVASGAIHRIPSKEDRLKLYDGEKESPMKVNSPKAPAIPISNNQTVMADVSISENVEPLICESFLHDRMAPPFPPLPLESNDDFSIHVPPPPPPPPPFISSFHVEKSEIKNSFIVPIIPPCQSECHEPVSIFVPESIPIILESDSVNFLENLTDNDLSQSKDIIKEKEGVFRSPSMDPITCFNVEGNDFGGIDFEAMISSSFAPPPSQSLEDEEEVVESGEKGE